jgi:hypothetical protein
VFVKKIAQLIPFSGMDYADGKKRRLIPLNPEKDREWTVGNNDLGTDFRF